MFLLFSKTTLKIHAIMDGRYGCVGKEEVSKRQQRHRPTYYDEQVVQELSKLWQLLDYLCGKRLGAILPELMAKLEKNRTTSVSQRSVC